MPFIRVWIHFVWATKNRQPLLTDEIRPALFDHITQNAITKNIFLDRVNGYIDHVHCLISLGSDQTIEKVAQLIKGESSFWLNNKSGLNISKFEWQDEYFAVSVSESSIGAIRAYIDNQENHHKKKTFTEEYQEFIRNYNFSLAKAGKE
jgi:REP element-mobilizing transposase RayT